MTDTKNELGTAPVGKLLFRLAIPTLVAQLINMLYNIVDRIYIGHIPENGNLAYIGVGVCLPIIMIVTAFAALISSGGGPKASIYMGQKDNKKAEKILGACLGAQLVISAVLTTVLLIWNEDLLPMFGASPNTIKYATDYMNIYALGTVFVQVTLGMNAFITAEGFTRTSMISVLIGAVTNIVLDPILIFGCHLGVKGAAIATVISQCLSTIWAVSFLCSKKTILKIRFKNLIPYPSIVLPCIALGTATFVMQASESVIFVCFNSSLLKYGGDIAVGAMISLGSIMQFAMLPLLGIGQGAQPIISYNYGAKNVSRVKKTFRLLLISCLSFSFFLWAMIMIFPTAFASMFCNNAELIEFTAKAIRIYFAVLLIFGIQNACQTTFVAIGNAPASITVAVVRKFVLLLPLIYIVPQFVENKTMGVYLAEPIADFLAITFTGTLFFFQFRKAMKKLKEDAETYSKEND